MAELLGGRAGVRAQVCVTPVLEASSPRGPVPGWRGSGLGSALGGCCPRKLRDPDSCVCGCGGETCQRSAHATGKEARPSTARTCSRVGGQALWRRCLTMEMWRPRLRCTLQHSSHTSTPLLMEAQPGSAGVGGRVSHSQTRARPPEHRPGPALRLELHAHLLTQSPTALGAGPAMRTLSSGGGRDSHQSQALSYRSLPLWGGVVPRAYSAGKASCPAATATSSTAFPQGTRLPP